MRREYSREQILRQRNLWAVGTYPTDDAQEAAEGLGAQSLRRWRKGRQPDGKLWQRGVVTEINEQEQDLPRIAAAPQVVAVEETEAPVVEIPPETAATAIMGELESRLRLVSLVEKQIEAVTNSLSGPDAIPPRNFNDLTSALATAAKILEVQMKAIEGLRESEERMEQKLIRVFVDLSDYLQLTPKQLGKLQHVRLAGVVPKPGTPEAQKLEVAPIPEPDWREQVPEVQVARLALAEFDGAADEAEEAELDAGPPVVAPGPERAMVEDEEPEPKKKRDTSFWTPERRAAQREKFAGVRAKRDENLRRKREESARAALEAEAAGKETP